MTPTQKVLKAVKLALQSAGLDGNQGMSACAIFVTFKRAGQAEVEIKPTLSGSFDLTAA